MIFFKEDTSYIAKSSREIKINSNEEKLTRPKDVSGLIRNGRITKPATTTVPRTKRSRGVTRKFKYRAKQLLMPNESSSLGEALPIGSNMVGRLLTAIDTRDQNQLVKVILPYGGKFKNNRIIERNTMLLGRVRYSGKGEKVFITFDRGVLPSGSEFKLMAQALSSNDYSSGLIGEYHSQADMRFLANVGLNMLSVGTDILTKKEALSDTSAPTPKTSFRNALYQGVSKGADMEGQRQATDMANKQEYVTIDAGEDLIINLTASLPISRL